MGTFVHSCQVETHGGLTILKFDYFHNYTLDVSWKHLIVIRKSTE